MRHAIPAGEKLASSNS